MNHSNHFGQVLAKTWRPTNRFVKTIPILLFALFLNGKKTAQSNVDPLILEQTTASERWRSKRAAKSWLAEHSQPSAVEVPGHHAAQLHRPIESRRQY